MERIKDWFSHLRSQSSSTVLVHTHEARVCDLPIYPTSLYGDITSYRFVEADPLPTQLCFEAMRHGVEDSYERFANRFGTVKAIVDNGKSGVRRVYRFFMEEDKTLTKSALIVIGGMAGLLMGRRKGGALRQGIFSAAGLATMTAACYPDESLEVARTAVAHGSTTINQVWGDFKKSPDPPAKESKDTISPTSDVRPDNDMYSARSDK